MLKNIIKKQSGFTLIEIAVVLVIVGLLIGSFIGSFSNRIDTTRRDTTKKELKEIKQQMLAYVYTQAGPFYSLPCPDTDVPPDGFGNGAGGVCTAGAAVGTFPWVTFGFGREDTWATHYSYWVDPNYSNNTASITLATAGGGGTIQTRVNDAALIIVPNVIAVVLSRGKNGLGGISSDGINRDVIPAFGNGHDDELDNADADNVFMTRPKTDEGVASVGGAFDDIIIWINAFEIKAKLVETNILP